MAWKTSYYHFDAVGSTRVLTRSDQGVRVSCPQTAFGEQLTNSASVANPFRFVGQSGYYYDSATDSHNVRQRVYDAASARWLSQDPARSDQNLFRYVGNSPLNRVDPTGLQEQNISGLIPGQPLPRLMIVVKADAPKPKTFILEPKDFPMLRKYPTISELLNPGKSVTIATDLTVKTEIETMFPRPVMARDSLSGAFVEDIRAAGFDVIYDPTGNVRHARIVAGERWFDVEGREWLATAFDKLGRQGTIAATTIDTYVEVPTVRGTPGLLSRGNNLARTSVAGARSLATEIFRTNEAYGNNTLTAVWILSSLVQHQREGSSLDANVIGQEFATKVTNPILLMIEVRRDSGLPSMVHGMQAYHSQVVAEQQEYLKVLEFARRTGGEIGEYGTRRERGIRESELNYLIMTDSPELTPRDRHLIEQGRYFEVGPKTGAP